MDENKKTNNSEENTNKFVELLCSFFKKKYLKQAQKDFSQNKPLLVDFVVLDKFSTKLSDKLIEHPDEWFEYADEAIELIDFGIEAKKIIRVFNLYSHKILKIKDLRSSHINRFISFEGIIKQASEVRPEIVFVTYECPACGAKMTVIQDSVLLKKPYVCECGNKRAFVSVMRKLRDVQRLELEEMPEKLEGGAQPRKIGVFLRDDLVDPSFQKNVVPGAKINLTGILRDIALRVDDGKETRRRDIFLEANYLTVIEQEFEDIKISKEDEDKIKELASDERIYSKLVKSIAPSIYGHEKIKQAIAYQLFGGSRKERTDGVTIRGDIHIFLVGDPGSGKCIEGNTKIMLESGEIKTIQSLKINKLKNKLKVLSANKNGKIVNSPAKQLQKRKPPKQMIKITTASGYNILLTPEHPLFTTKSGIIFSKKANDFKANDFIATPSKINIKGKLQNIPTNIIKTPAHNKVKYKLKNTLNEEFARLLGYLTGDGYVRVRKTAGVISFTNLDKVLLDDFEYLIKKIFNLDVSKRKKQNSDCSEYYVCSIELARILEKINANIVKKSIDMSISNLIAKSTNSVLAEFIKALFDCEAYISKKARLIEFSSKSRELVYDLKYLLLRFSIISHVASAKKCATNTINKTKRTYWQLSINGINVLKYKDKIGFTAFTKKQALNKLADSQKILNTNTDVVPNLDKLLKELRKKYNLNQYAFDVKRSTYQHYEKADRNPSYEKLKAICKKYNQLNNNDSLIEILNQISNAEIFWDKIKSIEKIQSIEKYVWDIEIDKVHNFVANGIIVHNSQILKYISKLAPKARYIVGKSTSGAGITATVVKDEFMRGWALEAGALVLANKGMALIDELDKMSKDDRSAMHEALEQQTITISKANVQATLHAQTTVLAAANPKFGRFDAHLPIAEQINIPDTLLSRFDLIFPIRDVPDKEKDTKLVKHILKMHEGNNEEKTPIERNILKKYIAYAKIHIRPKLTKPAEDEIEKFYVNLRSKYSSEEKNIVPLGARQLEALIRLSEASAKVRLSKQVDSEDAKRAIKLMRYCLTQVGVDPETGELDIDRLEGRTTGAQRNKLYVMLKIIEDLQKSSPDALAMIDDILDQAENQNLNRIDAEVIIEKLKASGDIYEPSIGKLKRL